ncbi:MAG: DsbA family protein [Gaiellaceae bacterium]
MSRKRMYVIAAVAGVVVVGALVGVSLVGGKSSSKASSSTTTVANARNTAALLAGIPQHGDTLGSPKAPVTLVEYADMQCPYCAEYARTTLPVLIRDYVRTGKVRMVFHGLEFVGPDSDTALRAVYAAGQQNKFWNYSHLMFENQGTENTGWVTEDLIKAVGEAVPGLDVQKMLDARKTQLVTDAIAVSGQRGQFDGVDHTPWFQVGKTGGATRVLDISSLDPSAFTPALDQLLNT